jgi:hypothetical protein
MPSADFMVASEVGARARGRDFVVLSSPKGARIYNLVHRESRKRYRGPCACGIRLSYERCCLRWHEAIAQGAEAPMRSRYTVFVLGFEDYLLVNWHPTTRPQELELAGSPAAGWGAEGSPA